AFSWDESFVVAGMRNHSISVWSILSRDQTLGPLAGHDDEIRAVAFSFDGTYLISGSEDCNVRIWCAQTGAAIAILTGHTGGVTCLSVSPVHARVASGSRDRSIVIWDLTEHTPVRRLCDDGELHSRGVTGLAWSPDGRRLISGSSDGVIRVWDP
ncbi:WD40 repeat-like protein, partial [Exidia glandulosa HHB12029]